MHVTISSASTFKAGTSTAQCSFAVNMVIKYYSNRGSQIYSVKLMPVKHLTMLNMGGCSVA